MFKKIPSVLGELGVGVLLGAIPVLGLFMRENSHLSHLAELGAILLLFEAGLKSTFDELKQVGGVAGRVAIVGVVVPLFLGILVSWAFGATQSFSGHIFIGATLTATSIGITARVLRDLKYSNSKESKIIMAAAVFDDILGLVLLAIATSMVHAAQGGEVSWYGIFLILLKTVLFLLLSWIFGRVIVPPFFNYALKNLNKFLIFISGLALCLVFSVLAHYFGLAPILGAYFAGLMIDPKEVDDVIERQLKPLTFVFVPLFFIMMGAKVDLSILKDMQIFQLGIVLSIVAILGKVISGYVVEKDLNRLVIGVGMVPRGEVGLIFASLGVTLALGSEPVLTPPVFGAILLMVIITSIISPVWLERLLKSNRSR